MNHSSGDIAIYVAGGLIAFAIAAAVGIVAIAHGRGAKASFHKSESEISASMSVEPEVKAAEKHIDNAETATPKRKTAPKTPKITAGRDGAAKTK